MPKKTELTERGIGGLWAAMGRRGGVDAWREVVAAHLAGAPAPAAEVVDAEVAVAESPAFVAVTEPTEEEIAIAAYFLYRNGHPGDPETHWQTAARQLAAV